MHPWWPDGSSQINRSSVFGPLGFWTMAPLRYVAKFDPFLSLDCAGVEGMAARKFCHLETLSAPGSGMEFQMRSRQQGRRRNTKREGDALLAKARKVRHNSTFRTEVA